MIDQTKPAQPASPAAKKPRRRLTPEERIREREQEIARIKEQQKMRVRERIEEAKDALAACANEAGAAGMESESKRCSAARDVLTGAAKQG